MRIGRRIGAVSVVVGALAWFAPPAAASQLLETLNVDAGSPSLTTGTVQLKPGTKYELQVSGTFTLANGFGQSYQEDALYCYGDSGFDSPQCTPTPVRMGDFYIGSGASLLKNIDAYQEPGGGGTELGYSVSHTYIVDFYPPADGRLTAGGTLAYSHCKSGSTPCTTTVNGTVTIQIYGPSSGGPPPPSFALLSPPKRFCPSAAADTTPVATVAEEDCLLKSYLRAKQEEKSDARYDLRGQVFITAAVCRVAVQIEFSAEMLDACYQMVQGVVHTLEIAHDPPDPSFATPTLPRPLPPLARQARSCPAGLSAARCSTLNSTIHNFFASASAATSAAGYVVLGANRFAGAVQANSVVNAFVQEAYGKVNMGVWTVDLAAQQFYGKALAKLLPADHLNFSVTPRQAKNVPAGVISDQLLSEMVAGGLASSRSAARKLLLAQLGGFSGTLRPSALGTSIPSSSFTTQYKSIKLSEVAVIVTSSQQAGVFSSPVTRTLLTDLANAQSRCGNASQRTAQINKFISDARAQAGSGASFLALAARPLLAANLPASSCQ